MVMVMDLVAYQNAIVHAQTFQQRLAVQNSEVVAMPLSLLEKKKKNENYYCESA